MSVALNVDNSISWPPFKVPFARLFVLEVNPVSNLKGLWCVVYGLLSHFNLFSSSIFFAIASASLCVSRFNIPVSESPKNVAWVLIVDVEVGSGPCHIPRRMVFQQ